MHLTHLAKRPDVPVVEGAHTSLKGVTKERIADFVHGKDGFGDTQQKINPDLKPHNGSAAEFIVKMACEHPGEVRIEFYFDSLI